MTLDGFVIWMIETLRPILPHQCIDESRIHVGGHIHADVVTNDQEDVGMGRRPGIVLCRQHCRTTKYRDKKHHQGFDRVLHMANLYNTLIGENKPSPNARHKHTWLIKTEEF